MKISHLILIGFSSILVLFSVSTFINYRQSELIKDNAEKSEHSSQVIENSNRFQRNFLNMVSGLRGYLLTNEDSFIQTYDSARMENSKILEKLTQSVPELSDQRILLDEIRELEKYWVNEFAKPLLQAKEIAAQSEKDKQAFNKLYSQKLVNKLEKDVQKSLQRKFSEFIDYEYGIRLRNKETLAIAITRTKNISIILTSISFIIGGCIAFFIARYISFQIIRMAKMANAIADGDYTVKISGIGQSELGRLGQSLNQMASTLSANFALLKKQKDEVDQFAHIVSHDLKAPLRGIDNLVNWIQEDHLGELSPKVNEYLELIKGRISRTEKLLNAIMMYARAGKESVQKEKIDVNELLLEIKSDIQKNYPARIIIRSNMPVMITERVPLHQIFSNLIVNAVKYHDKPDGFVKVYYTIEGAYYRFYVEDDGSGIKPIYHKKIFTIFQTLPDQERSESVGVGLAIVKKILDDRNLCIHLTSVPGKGSTFSFKWPIN